MELRAHHLLCLTTYRGKGYSEAFVAEMDRVHDALRSGREAGLRLVVTEALDVTCRACPNREGEGCRFQQSVVNRDRRMLAELGLAPGEAIEAGPAIAWVRDRHEALQDAVCQGCSWFDLCAEREFTL